MNISEELEKAVALKEQMEALVRDLTNLRPEYEPFADMVGELVLGTTTTISVACEDGEDGACRVEAREPSGGLWESYRYLVDVITALELELDYEQPSALVEPEFFI